MTLSRGRAAGRRGLVIFDCDGVLVDSEHISARVTADALRRLGWEMTADDAATMFLGCSDEHFAAAVERQTGRPLPSWWSEQVDAELRAAFGRDLRAVAGARDAVVAAGEAGWLTCVASNGSHDKIEYSLRLTGLWPLFGGRVFSAADVERGKPHPDVFLRAASAMEVPPAACVVVEDSEPGVAAAAAAGMRVVHYVGDGRPAISSPGVARLRRLADLSEILADHMVDPAHSAAAVTGRPGTVQT